MTVRLRQNRLMPLVLLFVLPWMVYIGITASLFGYSSTQNALQQNRTIAQNVARLLEEE
jgi:hypothetical protein